MNNGFGSDWVMQTGRDEAKDRLREKAQNEQTCIALNDMLKDTQEEVRRLREENERLRERAKTIGELEQLAARSNNNLLVENDRLREENERMRVVLESACEKMKQWSDMLQAIDAARGAK